MTDAHQLVREIGNRNDTTRRMRRTVTTARALGL
jgi:hypothetical protein